MVMEVPKKRCLTVSQPWQNLDGSLWQRQWLALRHPRRYGLAKTGDPYLVPRWTPEFCRPICPSKESLLLLSQWIRLPRDDLHIRHATNSWLSPDKVKVALGPDCEPHRIPFERCLWILAFPTLICSLDPRNLPEATLNNMVKQEESQTPDGSQTQTKVLPAPEEVSGDFTIAGGQLWSSRSVSPDSDSAWWNSCQVQKPSALDSSSARLTLKMSHSVFLVANSFS